MIWIIFFLGCAVGVTLGVIFSIKVDNSNNGTLFIYPDNKGRMCTVADFTIETVNRLKHDPSFKTIKMDIKHLDPVTRKNISPYNEESSTTVL